jgi:hypothetical protein
VLRPYGAVRTVLPIPIVLSLILLILVPACLVSLGPIPLGRIRLRAIPLGGIPVRRLWLNTRVCRLRFLVKAVRGPAGRPPGGVTTFGHLPGGFHIADRSARAWVVGQDRLTESWGLGDPNAARNDRSEDERPEMPAYLVGDLI